MIINKEKTNSFTFLLFMFANGFNPNNYGSILELGQSANGSISQFLRAYQQYLLSEKVIYSELTDLGIDGAHGYVETGEIVVPKSLANDRYFFVNGARGYFRRHNYDYPSIDQFGVIICEGLSPDLCETSGLKQDKYFGLCLDINDPRKAEIENKIDKLIHLDKYDYNYDINSRLGKEFHLLKKTR